MEAKRHARITAQMHYNAFTFIKEYQRMFDEHFMPQVIDFPLLFTIFDSDSSQIEAKYTEINVQQIAAQVWLICTVFNGLP